MRERGVRIVNCLNLKLGCFRIVKNMLFYSDFGRYRPIISIDGYDETVYRGPFQLSPSRPIVIDGSDPPRDLNV